MGFWQLMIKKDDLLIACLNRSYNLANALKPSIRKRLAENKSEIGVGRKLFIVLNGPSLKNQTLEKWEKTDYLFVNRGFKHPDYQKLAPTYHAFVDPKVLSGEWPVSWFDEIRQLVPDITFLLPASWAQHDKIKPLREQGFNIHWLPAKNPLLCLGVSGSCFEFAIDQKFEEVGFTGFDANGLAYELVNASSHFYGTNEENLTKTSYNYVIDLYMHSRHLHDLRRFAQRSKRKGVSFYNYTNGGLLDMFERKTLI